CGMFSLLYEEEIPSLSRIEMKRFDLQHNRLEFDWLYLKSVKAIAQLLPNITHLQVASEVRSPVLHYGEKSRGQKSKLLDSIRLLLEQWCHQLEVLQLFHNFSGWNHYTVDCDAQTDIL